MAQGDVSPNGPAACGAPSGFPEATFDGVLLREQYRALTRLGPYVHGIVIVAALALFGVTAPTGWLLNALPVALIAVSFFRLVSWFQARAGVELKALDLVRRKVRAASVVGPTMAFAFVLTAAMSTWRDSVLEFALVLLAVWVGAVVCAMCLNRIAGEANVIVIAATAPLIVAFLARGAELTLVLGGLVAIIACFVIRMLDEHFRMFAEIVQSRFVIAESQRAAEAGRQAAMTIALTDDLTGLANRRCFQSRLADRIGTATETGEPFALGLIDLDKFKPINDVHGHAAGDEILKQVAKRLAKIMDGRGSAARIGGDEFAILCDGIGARGEAVALAQEIQALFATPLDAGPLGLRLTCACGFALFPSCAAEPSELVGLADAALYRAKASGPGGAAVFDARAGRMAVRGTAFEDAFRRAVAQSELVDFGPIAEFATRTSRFESHARLDERTGARASWPKARSSVHSLLQREERMPSGIHHVTSIAGSARRNLDFYARTLGLRLVKKTVNFDDPSAYHLYYGDAAGHPGTILTFFPWEGAAPGQLGVGEAQETVFSIPEGSIGYWTQRLVEKAVAHDPPAKRFGATTIAFKDQDGTRLALTGVKDAEATTGWSAGGIPAEHSIRGFHSVSSCWPKPAQPPPF